MNRNETKLTEEYCWAITQAAGRSCCGRSGSITLEFGFFTYIVDHMYAPLRAGRSGGRIPAGARFSAPVQTGPGAPPSLRYNGYRVFFPRVMRPGRVVDHPTPSSTAVKERVQQCLYFPSGPSRPVLGLHLPLPYACSVPTCAIFDLRPIVRNY